jgi:hypothetical protein
MAPDGTARVQAGRRNGPAEATSGKSRTDAGFRQNISLDFDELNFYFQDPAFSEG